MNAQGTLDSFSNSEEDGLVSKNRTSLEPQEIGLDEPGLEST